MYLFHVDPGHGYLEVPMTDVVASGASISGYSFTDGRTAYLEEDCDMPAFLQAIGDPAGDRIGHTVNHRGNAPCRRLPRFKPR